MPVLYRGSAVPKGSSCDCILEKSSGRRNPNAPNCYVFPTFPIVFLSFPFLVSHMCCNIFSVFRVYHANL